MNKASKLSVVRADTTPAVIVDDLGALVRNLNEKAAGLEAANLELQEELAMRKQTATTKRAILDALPAHIALLDSDGVIQLVNGPWQRFAAANGLQSPALGIGSNYLQICDKAREDRFEEAVDVAAGIRAVLGGEIPEFSTEYPCHSPSQQRWFRVIVTPLREFSAIGALVTHLDITAAWVAALETQKSADRLDLAVSASTLGVWDWTPSTGRIVWNKRMHDLYGIQQGSDINYEIWASLVHPDDIAMLDAALQPVVMEDGKSVCEFRIVPRTGETRHIYSTQKVMRDAAGKPIGVVGINYDMTERKFNESKIKEMNARVETLVGEANVGIMVHHEFKLIMANDQFARLFGYGRKSDILEIPDFRILLSGDEQERISRYNRERKAGGKVPASYSFKGRKKDGSTVELEAHEFPIQWGDQSAVCAMLTDVTVRNRNEAQLRQSQRLEAVGQLTGGVAHDFNNLLTVIMGNAELIEEATEEEPSLHSLARITRKAAEQGAELTRRLLTFSRKQPLDPDTVDVNGLVGGMDGLFRRALGAAIEIKTICGTNLWNVLIDTSQFENALLNLCVNSRDAMQDGGMLIIETANVYLDEVAPSDQQDAASGQYVMVAVSDTGSGMDSDTMAMAFEPFFTTKDVGKGSGLGLSMVYGFVKQSMGHVRIYSKPGHGTTVKVFLPRSYRVNDSNKPGAETVSATGGSEKILVVEDNELLRDQVTARLESLGYQVVSAANGLEAIETLKIIYDFDLVFTDMVMPGGINGRQVADEAVRLYPGIAVLLTSGYTEDAVINHGGRDDGVHLLSKPYHRKELAAKIRVLLDGE